jgi:c(7)-type cytochrome triheme protein
MNGTAALVRPRRLGAVGPWKVVLILALIAGAWATVVRFTQGLGAATHLSDSFPWGLWIGFDLLVGVGLAAGGFVVAATVHIFRIEKYEPIARPAVLTAFLGYLLVIVALLYDIGRPWNIWHPLVMWNPHSVMFEVAWCVMLYTSVLALEFSPLVFEKLGWHRPLGVLRAAFVPLVILGVLLSTLHQSSLGTLYVIVPGKLHGLWYTPLLPVFFFVSAIAAGLAMTIVESCLSSRAFGKRIETELLQGMARVIVVVLSVFTVWKAIDLLGRGNLPLVFRVSPESAMFWGEMALGAVLPAVLFAIPRVRASERGLFFGAVLTVLGFILGRLNVAITGMAASSGVTYVPSWMEFAVSLMLVALGFAAFAAAVRWLPVFHGVDERPEPAARPARPLLSRGMLAFFWGFLAIGAGLLWVASARGPAPNEPRSPSIAKAIAASVAGDPRLPADYTFPMGASSPGPVTFRHETHWTLVDRATCATCHATGFRLRSPGTPQTGALTQERIHEGDLCASCHNGRAAFAVDDDCTLCHAR